MCPGILRMLRWLLESFNLFRQEKHPGKKTLENLKDSLCVMGNPPEHPEKQGPYEGTMVVNHPLRKPYFLGGRGRVAFLVARHLRNEEEMKPEADWHCERRDSKHWPLLLVFLRFRNAKFHLFVVNWAMKANFVVWGILEGIIMNHDGTH